MSGAKGKHEPDDKSRQTVSMMTAIGIQQTEIAQFLAISVPTLHKHYRREMDTGLVRANTTIAGRLFAAAEKGNTTAQIFWLKTRAGWTETVKVDGDLGFAKLLEVLERRRKKVRG